MNVKYSSCPWYHNGEHVRTAIGIYPWSGSKIKWIQPSAIDADEAPSLTINANAGKTPHMVVTRAFPPVF